MKVLSLTIALYFFTASVFPCSDIGAIVFSPHAGHSAEQTDGIMDDDCTSLCVCNCCGVVFEIPFVTAVPNAPFTYSQRFTSTTLHPLTDELSTIWQPPRIS